MAKGNKKFELPVTYIVWDDAYSDDDWTSLDKLKGREKPCVITSIGFLADEDENHVTLIMTSETGNLPDRVVATTLTIPRAFIVSMETLVGNGRWKTVINNTKKKEDENT